MDLFYKPQKERERKSLRDSELIDIPPRTPIEEMLIGIWTQVLGCEHIGVKDHFRDLGGTSLHATRIFACLKEVLGVNLSRSLILETPTIAQMAAYIELTCPDTISIVTLGQGRPQDMPTSLTQ